MKPIDWKEPVNVLERGTVIAVINKHEGRYTVTNLDSRVSSDVDTFKDAAVMREWLAWAYPKATALMQGDTLLKAV